MLHDRYGKTSSALRCNQITLTESPQITLQTNHIHKNSKKVCTRMNQDLENCNRKQVVIIYGACSTTTEIHQKIASKACKYVE